MSRAYKTFVASKDPDAIPTEADAEAAAIAEIKSMFATSDQIQNRVAQTRLEFEKKKVCARMHDCTRSLAWEIDKAHVWSNRSPCQMLVKLISLSPIHSKLPPQAQVDSHLSNLVNTQIEESRYALELLASSTRDMLTTRSSFSDIDQYCEKVQALLPGVDPNSDAHCAALHFQNVSQATRKCAHL